MANSVNNVILLGGLMGSYLDNYLGDPPRRGRRFWYSVPAVAKNYIRYLQLASDGVTPALAIKGTISPTAFLPPTFDALSRLLRASGYDVVQQPTDWRLDINLQASRTLTAVATYTAEPFAIVAHSMGGLVARAMWQQSGAGSGFQANCKRLITLGTPHWGSYSAVQSFSHLSAYYYLIASLAAYVGLSQVQIIKALLTADPFGFLDTVITSWPSMYQLCPNPNQPNGKPDPFRPRITQPSSYTPLNKHVSASWFANAATYWSYLTTAPTQPPLPVLVCVRGSGFDTDGSVAQKGSLFIEPTYYSEDGDGVVTVPAATLGSEGLVTVYSAHADLPMAPAVLQNVVNWIEAGTGSSTIPVTEPGSQQQPPIVGPFAPVALGPPLDNASIVATPLKPEVIPLVPPAPVTAPPAVPAGPPAVLTGAGMPSNCPTTTGMGQPGFLVG